MDKIDTMLVSLLQKNARASLKYLASKVFLSTPAVSARIEKLEKQYNGCGLIFFSGSLRIRR